jgi:alkanesulfonate monooxygenase SsuD/methylene tetrahydromethanopterin reductase-like flavin-dependent oxidoreductase (luciferase family)
VKLGVLVESEEGLDWRRWRATAAAVERLGFDSLWLSDHLDSPWFDGRHGLDPFVALSVAAAETSRLRLGTLVSPVTFRAPAIVARMAEAIDRLAGGRFVLGLGLGWNDAEHAAHGLDFPSTRQRRAALEAALTRISSMWDGQLLLGGSGDGTLTLAARFADGWNKTGASVPAFQERTARLDNACRDIGRATDSIERSIAAGVLIGRDRDELRARRVRLEGCVPPLVGTDAAELGWLDGTVADVTHQLTLLAQAGVNLAILGHYDLDDTAALELIAAEVLPAVA